MKRVAFASALLAASAAFAAEAPEVNRITSYNVCYTKLLRLAQIEAEPANQFDRRRAVAGGEQVEQTGDEGLALLLIAVVECQHQQFAKDTNVGAENHRCDRRITTMQRSIPLLRNNFV